MPDQSTYDSTLRPFRGRKIDGGTDTSLPLLLKATGKSSVRIAENVQVSLAAVSDTVGTMSLDLELGAGARVSLTHLIVADAFSAVNIALGEDATVDITAIALKNSASEYRIDLLGDRSCCIFNGMMLSTGREHVTLDLNISHRALSTRSLSAVKAVAGGESTSEFRGLVYVARDAQKTDASQQSRNIEISKGKVLTSPQLEIYADDVQCSHGATVGRLDEEAIYYMRQRGISLDEARRLQTEGFLKDIVMKSDIDVLRREAETRMTEKLERL